MTTHRPCAVLALILAAGILAGKIAGLSGWLWLFAAAICGAGFSFKRGSRLLYAWTFCLGAAWIAQHYLLPPQSIAFVSPKEVAAVEGVVSSDIERGSHFDLDVRQILLNGKRQNAGGKVRVKFYGDHPPGYGQYVRIRGRPQLPLDFGAKGGFSYRRYLQEQGTYWVLRATAGACEVTQKPGGNFFIRWSLRLRHWMEGGFYRYLEAREAGFVAALVLGDRRGMPEDLKEIFVNTGTAHILAISGMNMSVIVGLLFFLFRLSSLPRQAQVAGTVAILFAYAFISGWSASVVRACIMSSVILAGFAFERESDGLNSLGLAGLILLTLDPRNLFDIGFQLSFAAVAGILLLYKPCGHLLRFLPACAALPMAVSLAAWAATAPITFYHFYMLTPISILANIPIVPMADMIMALGLGLAFWGRWLPPMAVVLAACIKALLSGMVICAAWFNQIPFGHFGP